jgi:glycosyltransferase involved in cell wall biosynthesis
MPLVSIIVPTLNRPQQLIKLVDNINATTADHQVETIVVVEDSDSATWAIVKSLPGVLPLSVSGNNTPIYAWNYGLKHSLGEWVVQAADDMEFTPDWLSEALATPNKGFIAFPDETKASKNSNQTWEPHYMATREWLRTFQHGVLAVPHYRHWGCDVEICERAAISNTFTRAKVIVKHNHWLKDASRIDSTYQKAQKWYQRDLNLLELRRSMGFPDDFSPVI